MSKPTPDIPATARLMLDSDALVSNWHALDRLSGSATAGAAVKADGYGLGSRDVVTQLITAGCKDFYVANWQEASELEDITGNDTHISVLNGVRESDMAFAKHSSAKPVINSLEQAKRWAQTGRICDVMINSGMNRLGIDVIDLTDPVIAELNIDIAMSHLASADEDSDQNNNQLAEYLRGLKRLTARRKSLANSTGIILGSEFHFDCTRPGISLYGGVQRQELAQSIKQVAIPQAEILQVRSLKRGDKVGYNALYIAEHDHQIATLAMGYADGYLRGFSNVGFFRHDGKRLPVLGRVSMDLIAIDISGGAGLGEGDWVDCDYHLPTAATQSGLSQYELITGLGQRLPRVWS